LPSCQGFSFSSLTFLGPQENPYVANSSVGVSTGSSKQAAAALSACLRPHELVRDARCLLCATVHKQSYVGAVLCEDGQPIGDLCPRCLGEPPLRCAEKVLCRAAWLWAEIGAALLRDNLLLSGRMPVPEQRRRAEDRRRREAERRLRLAGLVQALPEPEPVTQAEKEHFAELLLTLAGALGRVQEWSITPAMVQEAERAAVQARLRTGPRKKQPSD
jgi:hypothetical protein